MLSGNLSSPLLCSNYPLQLSVIARCLFMARQDAAAMLGLMMGDVWLLSCISP